MKSLINKIVYSKIIVKLALKPLLKLHSLCSKTLGSYASIAEGGIHPKHRILRYEDFFLENIEKDSVVLDVGSNTGIMTRALSKKAAFVYGIEIDEYLFSKAIIENSAENIEYINADATAYNYSNCKPIDCVALSNVLEHIENRVNFLKMLIEKPCWKAQKVFLIRVPSLERDWIPVYKKELGLEWSSDRTHFTEYTEKEFCREMEEAGLSVEKFNVRFGEFYAVCVKR